MATVLPSDDKLTEVPDRSFAASPLISSPVCTHALVSTADPDIKAVQVPPAGLVATTV